MNRASAQAAGFTFIEVLVSSALLAITVGLLSFQYVRQEQTRATIQLQQAGRQLLGDLLTSIATNSDSFPALTDTASGNLVTYVGCYNDDGTVKTTVGGTTGFEALFTSFTLLTSQTTVCAANVGGMEAHIRRDSSDPNKVYVHVIVLKKAATGTGRLYGWTAEQHFENTVDVRKLRSTDWTGAAPTPTAAPTIPTITPPY